MKLRKGIVLLVSVFSFFTACDESSKIEPPIDTTKKNEATPVHYNNSNTPNWAKSANIYEVNIRQYSAEGSFDAFSTQLPRLKEMGVDILWFMPIFPISQIKKKGTIGSPYAVADYKKVNPDFGSLSDFKELINKIHDLGMYAIIDWVPNHTGWDHSWITQHPNWYSRDSTGNIIDPINSETGKSWGWTDVADLNYDNADMRKEMIDAMCFWVNECNIDGFRCDVASEVPSDFWAEAIKVLNELKMTFRLAESDKPGLRNDGFFIMDYGWKLHHLMNDIVKGDKKALDLDLYLVEDSRKYYQGYHMNFTSNHDENSFKGSEFERMGDAHLTCAILTYTIEGMPLVYSGQESANKKRLAFFEKDSIDWGNYEYADFYKTLNELKHQNPALWNGQDGGELIRINTDKDQKVFAFMRQKDKNKVVVILNLSKIPQEFRLKGSDYVGEYNNIFAKGTTALSEDMMMNLGAWEYMVLSNY